MSVMSQVSDRGEYRSWPAKRPVSSLGALGIAVMVGIGVFTFRNVEIWIPLQEWYWTEYLTTKTFLTTRGDYQLLEKVAAHGKQLIALDAATVPAGDAEADAAATELRGNILAALLDFSAAGQNWERAQRRWRAAANDVPSIVSAFDEAIGGIMKDIVVWTVTNRALSVKPA